MTREKAVQVNHLLVKIGTYEELLDEIRGLETLEEISNAYDSDLEAELTAVVQSRLDKLLKELEEM
jgi:hypothetical protein